MNCATAASTQALVTALLLQVSNDCVDAAADVLAVVLCSASLFLHARRVGNFSHC
jgi:hypothetical protein